MGTLTYKIVDDMSPQNPCQEYDMLSKFIIFHRNYDFGNCKDFKKPDDFNAFRIFHKEEVAIWPLYMYDHSGITISLSPFSCPWDSGQVGWVWVPLETIKKEYGDCPFKEVMDKVYDIVKAEVQEMDYYVSGQTYGFEIVDEDDEVVDSCYGFYGDKYVHEAAKEAIDCLSKH